MSKDRYVLAEKHFTDLTKMDGAKTEEIRADAWLRLAMLAQQTGQADKAKWRVARALELADSFSLAHIQDDAHLFQAENYFTEKSYDKALMALAKIKQGSYATYQLSGQIAYNSRSYEDALKHFQSALAFASAEFSTQLLTRIDITHTHIDAINRTRIGIAEALNKLDRTDEARTWYLVAAEHGDSYAQFRIGLIYESGQGLQRDYSVASKWFSAAAKQGNPYAQYRLFMMLDENRAVYSDAGRANELLVKAAIGGLADAQIRLGNEYERNSRDDKIAIKWYRKAAEQGDSEAQFKLGQMYDRGRGVSNDDEAVLKWWRKAADQGHAIARYELNSKIEQIKYQKQRAENEKLQRVKQKRAVDNFTPEQLLSAAQELRAAKFQFEFLKQAFFLKNADPDSPEATKVQDYGYNVYGPAVIKFAEMCGLYAEKYGDSKLRPYLNLNGYGDLLR